MASVPRVISILHTAGNKINRENRELKRSYPAEVKFHKLSRRDNSPRSTGNYSPFAAYLAKSRDRSSGSINYLYLRGHCRTLQPNGGRWTSPPVYSTWFRNLTIEGKRGKEKKENEKEEATGRTAVLCSRNLRKGKASLGNEAPQYDNAIMFPVPHFPGSAPNPCFRLPQPPCPLFNRDFAIVLGADCYFARALT
ncbi:hypothetical protein G5I_09200 [Acromyrmex echinatior]|uniref:Uncharacterized protein n=1 Tax=Acromyrmex echinatior TaxID=103372 RepID=F4WTQ1_ACREC|nr:hypothetical protein G5I_09200 [Acromyrmex echinatior]